MGLVYKKDIIYRDLKQSILGGKYAPGEKLPKEEFFSRELGVSRETLRVVLDKLEAENMILRLKSKGTFVRKLEAPKKRFLVIAVFSGGNELPCHAIMPGIEHMAKAMNIEIETCDYFYFNMQSREEIAERLKTRNISGIILIATNFIGNEKIIELLEGHNVPVLLPFASRSDYQITGWATLAVAERAAWRDALNHLREMGHRRILTLTLANKQIREYSHSEYKELLKEIGADTSEDLIVYCPFESEAIRKAARKAIDRPMPPTAIMCFSDFWAPDVYYAVKTAGLRIPEDIAVMGFASGFNCEYIHPTLSTINERFAELGGKAVEVLAKADIWFKPDDRSYSPPYIVSEYRLEIRESTKIKRFEEKIKRHDLVLQNV